MWLVGVVSRRWVWLVGGIYGWLQCIGVVSGCCCKEVYIILDILKIIINFPCSTCISSFLAAASLLLCSFLKCFFVGIIESVDSISKDERGFPLTQYITNGRISRGGYTFTHFKHHHRVLRLISYSMSV